MLVKENTVDTAINYSSCKRIQKNMIILRELKNGNLELANEYSGFGGLRHALNQKNIQAELAEFLSPSEIERLRKSTCTGYFTPVILINFIYKIVQRLGFTRGKILEPACGHGAFFENMPKMMRGSSEITGIELEPLSATIAKQLYPDIRILNEGFQHFQETNFDLILGNPPYAPFTVFDNHHPDLSEEMIHHYFVAKSVRLLKEGGVLAMVVPCYVMDNPKRHLRHEIADVADLIAAYRLPENLFTDAKITVDMVICQRTTVPKRDWTASVFVDLANGDRFPINSYFINHPAHVIGKLDTYEAYSLFEERPRKGLRCVATVEEVQRCLPQLVSRLQPLNQKTG